MSIKSTIIIVFHLGLLVGCSTKSYRNEYPYTALASKIPEVDDLAGTYSFLVDSSSKYFKEDETSFGSITLFSDSTFQLKNYPVGNFGVFGRSSGNGRWFLLRESEFLNGLTIRMYDCEIEHINGHETPISKVPTVFILNDEPPHALFDFDIEIKLDMLHTSLD